METLIKKTETGELVLDEILTPKFIYKAFKYFDGKINKINTNLNKYFNDDNSVGKEIEYKFPKKLTIYPNRILNNIKDIDKDNLDSIKELLSQIYKYKVLFDVINELYLADMTPIRMLVEYDIEYYTHKYIIDNINELETQFGVDKELFIKISREALLKHNKPLGFDVRHYYKLSEPEAICELLGCLFKHRPKRLENIIKYIYQKYTTVLHINGHMKLVCDGLQYIPIDQLYEYADKACSNYDDRFEITKLDVDTHNNTMEIYAYSYKYYVLGEYDD